MIKKILGKFHKRSSSDEDKNQQKNYSNDEFVNGFSSFSSDCGMTECKYSPNGKSNPVLSRDGFYDLNPCGDGEKGVAMPVKYKRFGPKYGAKVGPVGEKLSYQSLPRFWEVPSPERVNLFIKKLNLCCVVYDFGNPIKHLKDKDVKRQTLLELVDFVELVSLRYDEVLVQGIVKMVSANLFRTFPVSFQDKRLLIDVYEGEEDEPFMEPSWPHLQVVYDFFLRFVSSKEMDVTVAKGYINHSFVLRLLNLFDSEDKREREFLKAILHRIYAKFVVHRRALREEIKNIFYEFIFETEKHNGIAELLQIMGSIINGFDLPLKEEHKLLLDRAIIPLHKPKCVSMYRQHLCYCIMQFLKKDHRLAETVISGLLKYWPITNSSKEVMFLDELEEILEATQAVEFQHCIVPLFSQIGRCVNSSQFQVAERALSIWKNDYIRNLILRNLHVTLPIILPHLERNSHSHWNPAVQNLAFKVKKIFSDDDQEFFDECSVRVQEDEIKEVAAKEKQALTWKQLEDVAASKAVNSEAVVHFRI